MDKISITVDTKLSSIFQIKTTGAINTLLNFHDKKLVEIPCFHQLHEINPTQIVISNHIDKDLHYSIFKRKLNHIFYQTCCKELYDAIQRTDIIQAASKGWNNVLNDPQQGPLGILEEVYVLREKMSAQLGFNLNGNITLVVPTASYYYLMTKAWFSISALEMMHEILPNLEVKVVHLPEFNYIPNFVAMLVYDDKDLGAAGYWAMNEHNTIWNSAEDPAHQSTNYQVCIPEVKLVLVKPKQIAVLKIANTNEVVSG